MTAARLRNQAELVAWISANFANNFRSEEQGPLYAADFLEGLPRPEPRTATDAEWDRYCNRFPEEKPDGSPPDNRPPLKTFVAPGN